MFLFMCELFIGHMVWKKAARGEINNVNRTGFFGSGTHRHCCSYSLLYGSDDGFGSAIKGKDKK
jgi:hypothetical protein